ncbi:Cytochrome P450 [Canna indica]|uniref:Cytochrome P450 n=1 Tax=Canna indica TaxID=4628 RepID=A0AAQ3Q4S8_9LILI|nr:Cytochrome P450 [Canna indica]
MSNLTLILSALLFLLLPCFWKALMHLIWRPYAIAKAFRKQGVRGPPYKFWFGSLGEMKRITNEAMNLTLDKKSHDITTRILPYYRKWTEEYGDVFLFWHGAQPKICISDPELVKQVLANKFGFYGKIDPPSGVTALLGKGLVLVRGSEWVRHRSAVSPAFTMDKLKILTKTMAECAKSTLQLWQDYADDEREIEVVQQFRELAADVIAHAAFGSSFIEGKQVFQDQNELLKMIVQRNLSIEIPGSEYIPSRRNLYMWKLDRRLRKKLISIIQARLDSKERSGYGNDLLGIMLEASEKQEGQKLSMDDIIDECKTFFFAGQETTSLFLTWTIYLLSTNNEWQEKLREEVLRECGMKIPNADMLSKLKLVTMVLLEAIRLYSPFIVLRRKADKDMNLGNINIPKGTNIDMPIMMSHRKKEIWGADAGEFNPLRFENGTVKAAAHPTALLSFSVGPRACIGQNFAMLEAKTVLAMILQRFSFSLSSKYIHAPMFLITVNPQYGLPVILKPLHV